MISSSKKTLLLALNHSLNQRRTGGGALRQSFDHALCVSIEQAAELLSLSRQKVYELIDREGLPVVRFGKSVRIRIASLEAWLIQREEAQQSS